MKIMNKRCSSLLLALTGAALAACGGGGSATSPPVAPPQPPPPVVETIGVIFSADDVVAGSGETGSATATVEYNVTNSEATIAVSLSGVVADAVSLHRGYAGSIGPLVRSLSAGPTSDEWELPATELNSTEATDLESGAWYLLITSVSEPAGALRGQILPAGVSVSRISLAADQVTAAGSVAGSAASWLTVDVNRTQIAIGVAIADIDDSTAVELRIAEAGVDGPLATALEQQPGSIDSWAADSVTYTAALQDALETGMLYVLISSVAFPNGALRGQYLPDTFELVVTDLLADSVVANVGVFKLSSPAGRAMTTIGDGVLTTHVNVFGISGVTMVELRQAPAGQNGPLLENFLQDPVTPSRWSLAGHSVDSATRAGLDNQTLYLNVSTDDQPGGIARGQIATPDSAPPDDPTIFSVLAVDPPNASRLTDLPETVFITLNREPLASTVTRSSVEVAASGGDGGFEDGNEITITPVSVVSIGNTIEVSFAGLSLGKDVYRITVIGGGNNGVVDTSGIALDGDGNGSAGGTFETAFEVAQPMISATLTTIQEQIYSVSCATSNCHTGANPPDGLDLSSGQAYSNTVGVQSVQMPSLLRIDPNDPDNSYLIRKIEGNGIVANRMPLGAPALSQEQIDLVRAWVSDGAPDN